MKTSLLVIVALALAYCQVRAQTTLTWTSTSDQTFSTGGNWSAGAPADSLTTHVAAFTGTGTVNPILTTSQSVAGLSFTGGTYTLTNSGGAILTLGASGIDDTVATNTQSINLPLVVGSAQTWISNASNNVLAVGGTVSLGANLLTLQSASTSGLTISGVVSGTGGLTKTGTGTATLSAANTFTGVVSINGGKLAVTTIADGGTASNLGASTSAASNLVIDSGTLAYSGSLSSTNRLFTLGASGALDVSGSGAISFTNTGSIAFSGTNTTQTLKLSGTTTSASVLTPILGDNGSGLTSLEKAGSGTWELAGANTFTGGTKITDGTLRLGADGVLAATGSVTINETTASSTATFAVNGKTQTIGALTFGGAGATSTSTNIVNLGTGTLNVGGTITYDATNNPIGAQIQATGAGNLGLAATRTFNIGDSSNATDDLSVLSIISGSGGIVKTGAGRLTLFGANTFTGSLTVNDGSVRLGNDNALTSSNPLVLNKTTSGGNAIVVIDVNRTISVGSVTFGGAGASSNSGSLLSLGGAGTTLTLAGNVTFDATNNPLGASINPSTATLNLGGNRTFTVADSANTTLELTVNTIISGTGNSLTKTGAGTLALAGVNTYTGATTISAGTLMLTGSLAAGSAVAVNGVLAGTGTASGAVTLNSGGSLSPGNGGIGTLTLGSLTWNSGGLLKMELGASNTSDLLAITGGLSGPSSSVAIDFGGTGQTGVFTLMTFSSVTGFTQSNFTFANLASGYIGSYTLNATNLSFAVTAVPEPAAYAALAALAGLAGSVVRRRRIRSA